MTKRIVRVFGVLGMSLALLAGPLAVAGSAHHRPGHTQYPPGAGRCRVLVTENRNFLRVRIVCPGLGISIRFRIILRSTPVDLGLFTTDQQGNLDATVTIPESVEPGSHHLQVFETGDSATAANATPQVLAGQTVVGAPVESIPLTLRGTGEQRSLLVGSADGTIGTRSASSTSEGTPGGGSSSTAPLTAAAVGLAAIGAGGAVLARRRRNAPDTDL